MNTNKSETLAGARIVPVKLPGGSAHDVAVRQLRLLEYPKALALLDDEIALTGLVCGLSAAELDELGAENYEELYAAVREVNEKGFFAYAARQQERGLKTLAALPPAMAQAVMERGQSISPTPPRPSPRPRA